ncbi:hypothetical protein KVR01_013647 [Diaporthe batatas]|uniref:uncharacterized protein n=1 Tax=Diaporthe batatas TaxID=748121 RepID=UPI001D03DF27|nr:uncharacterized protein KVR01_013647 [Diaporthe batatas]KAG8156543.1 hypothetical protein KVR01_013647 [Diaporthe batatas]
MADGDSALSTTANIIGILTFALATLSFCLAFYAVTADAPREMKRFADYVTQRKAHINEISEFFEDRDVEADNELEKSLGTAERRRKELQENVYKICGSSATSLTKRIWWWMERRDMSLAMAEVDMQIHHLTALQISFLLR